MEHRLERIEREEGQKEARFRFVCSCGVLGPDHGVTRWGPLTSEQASRLAYRDYKLHSEGKSTSEGDPEILPGAPYEPPPEGGR